MSLTFTDLFCGAGGSSTGLVEAGFSLVLAINHWRTALETHAANHRLADHLLADTSGLDMRRLPKTDVLWASPICTEISPAGGRRRIPEGQLFLLEDGPVDAEAFVRTRVTATDVIRAAEVHRYSAIVVENVTEFATDWPLFRWWLDGMTLLGYNHQIVSASSAHLGGPGNLPAPQWRDRLYIVFTRKGVRLPDLTVSPRAHCFGCGTDVDAVQTWRNGRTIGKYRSQYDFRCPNTTCRRAIVEPYVRPAADVIDWSNLGGRIGDRSRPLAAKTIERIRRGLELFPDRASVLTLNHGGHDGRATAAGEMPLPVRCAKQGEGLLVPVGGTWADSPESTAEPMRTRMTRETEALVTVPPFVVDMRRNGTARSLDEPLSTIATARHHGLTVPGATRRIAQDRARNTLVIPYRRAAVKTAAEPVHTLSTRDSAGLASLAEAVEDCHFRMLQPEEQLGAQRFPGEYIVKGTKGERTKQAGNAVSVNAASFLGSRLMEVLS
ncbi:DNA cytosine methyltransferase [Kitasatospora sp. NBC_01560]|uniref:DNA cytosine methyltransferase n=1 Tax=Kitasatospora sp. NBC_01560 TaxID=2975965 RepID=UPI0038639FA3